jgi:hypothetical protein
VSVRRLLTLPLLGALLLVAAPAQADEASPSARRNCGTIASTSIYPYARVYVLRGTVTCRGARSLARRYDRYGTTPRHWRCALAHDDLPRLFSCGSGGRSGDLRRWPRALEAIGTRRR